MIAELERRDAAPDADLETPVAEVVEDADLFREPQRRISGSRRRRPEPDALGRARPREIDAGTGTRLSGVAWCSATCSP
jgi:hypothetical protein